MNEYAITVYGPGRVVMSRNPEDVRAAQLEALRPAIEALAAAYEAERFWWAYSRRTRSRVVTRNKQRRNW